MAIDVFSYLEELGRERYRAVILHAAPFIGRKLTEFCQKVCHSLQGKYINLLDFFLQSQSLSAAIDRFSPEKLQDLIIEQSNHQSLIVIDQMDFLIDTWRKSERQNFYRFVANQWDGYKEGMKARLIFCLQTSSEIAQLSLTDSQGRSRILQLSDFQDLL